ncbi:hypothetical protein EHP00_276 [Ecytonucleospora hepatopenaei]|uniref:V-SNARE coiled-coil homology domain-containing protein n=1 Tax=Ecytonucleospora hepatopenaei TaxID=646526 RepID=A0A1W0E7D2_9MICR|nr:hypothetical protein EHP00_276 [Ecytonucleospora hepatopenaei]
MAILYTQFLNVNNKKLLSGSCSTQGVFLQEDYELLTELKGLTSKALHPDNILMLQTNKTYQKVSENSKFVFFIGVLPLFESSLCVACIADTRSTEKTIAIYFQRLVDNILNNTIRITNINVSCYGNDEKIRSITDSFNKEERTLNTNEILETTHAKLVENLDNLIYRGDNINKLKTMSESLKYETQFMSKRVSEMKRREQMKKYQTYAIGGFILFLIIYFMFLRK